MGKKILHTLVMRTLLLLACSFWMLPVANAQLNSDDDAEISVSGDVPFAQILNNLNNRNFELSFSAIIPSRSGQPWLPANTGGFIVDIPNTFSVPNTIATSSVLVDGVPAHSVAVSNNGSFRRVTVLSPNQYNGATPVITILQSAGISNPIDETTANIEVSLTGENATGNNSFDDGTITIQIEEVESFVSTASYTPSSSIADLRSRYRIEFSLGGGGRLTSGEQIFLDFASATGIPNGQIEGFSINGTPINQSNVVGNGTNRITITLPFSLGNNQAVDINITRGAGIRNPAAPGTYTGAVSTTREPTPVPTSPISYSDPVNLSFSAIELTDSRVNAASGYEVEFITGSASALFANSDQIVLEFPVNTVVPSSINPANILITTSIGFADQPTNITVDGRQIAMTVPFDIPGGSEVIVLINSSAGLQNPSQTINPLAANESENNYRLSAFTRNSDGDIVDASTPSNPYVITDSESTVSLVEVDLSTYAQNATATYTISFQTGTRGRIEGPYSSITVRFPSGTVLPGDLSTTNVTVNGVSAESVEASGTTGREIEITLADGQTIGNNQSVTVVVQNITNPGDGNIKTVRVGTSAEPSLVETGSYQLGNFTLSVTSTTLSSTLVNATGVQYVVQLNGAGNYSLGSPTGSVFIRFPVGSVIPESFSTANFTVTGQLNNVNSVSKIDARTIRIDVTRNGNNDAAINQITIQSAAGIGNPPFPGTYNIRVWASNASNPIAGPDYTLTARNESVSGVTIAAAPNFEGFSGAQYTVSFNTQTNGRLIGGTSLGSNEIYIQFPPQYELPASIPASNVSVNSVTANVVSVNTIDNIVTVEVPAGLTINASSTATVVFSSAAGIVNPAQGSYNIGVQTDVKAGGFVTGALSISDAPSLTISQFSISRNGTNDIPSYSIRFISGIDDEISAPPDGEIILLFDEKVGLPSSIAANRITINGSNANAVQVIGSTVVITVPQLLPAGQEHRININSNAGIINPYEPGSYQIQLTLPEPGSSTQTDNYTIVQKTSSISQPSVSVEESAVSVENKYTVSFNTGANGRLPANNSQIFIQFPAGFGFSSDSENPSINGNVLNAEDFTFEDGLLTLTVPIQIRNSSLVTIQLPEITNPATPGAYTLDVYTSIEPAVTESSAFFIGASGVVLNDTSFRIFFEEDEVTEQYVNTAISFEIEFELNTLLNTGGFIYVRLPEDSQAGNAPNSQLLIFDEGGTDPIQTLSQSSYNAVTRIVSYEVAAPLSAGTTYRMEFETLNGFTNPREPTADASVRYEIGSSTDNPVAFNGTPRFQLIPATENISAISNVQVRYGTANFDEVTNFRWTFNVGQKGALRNNVARIFLRFASNVQLNTDIRESDISFIDGNQGFNPASVAIGVDGPRVVTIVLPSGVQVGNGDQVIVEFSPSAGLFRTSNPEPIALMGAAMGDNMALDVVLDPDAYAAASSAEFSFTPGDDAVLPVEMMYFSIQHLNNPSGTFPALSWQTATEYENYGFYILRKFEDEEYWSEVGFVEGAGTSTQAREYHFTDNTLQMAGNYQYIIRQMDYDGTTADFGPLEFFFGAPETFALGQNYPNPFNPVTVIPISIPIEAQVSLQVYDILGRRVAVLVNEQLRPGHYNITFEANRFASGVYFVRMVSDGQVFTRKMTLIK